MPDQLLNQNVFFWGDANFWVAFWTFALFLSTTALVLVGWQQISSIRSQNAEQMNAQRIESIKWKTIEACNIYDFDPIIHECLIKTFQHTQKNLDDHQKKDLKVYVTSILNYLDGIAIGLDQGVYDEDIVKDHMQYIFKLHVSQYLSSREVAKSYGLEIDHFTHLVSLDAKWRHVKTSYNSQRKQEHHDA